MWALRCELLHIGFGLLCLLPLVVLSQTLTIFSRRLKGRGVIPGLCLVLFCLSWLLHIWADYLNLGF